MKIDRNGPCPCGSGKKFKKCHLGREAELGPEYVKPRITQQSGSAEPAAPTKPPINPNLIYGVVGLIAVAAVVLIFMGHIQWAVAGGGVALLTLGGFVILRDPPPPRKDGGDPSGINFGK